MDRKVVHIIDETTAEDAVRQLCMLVDHVPLENQHHVVHVGAKPQALTHPGRAKLRHVPRGSGLPWSFSLNLKRTLEQLAPDVIHAWGLAATSRISGYWGGGTPLLSTISDAQEARRFSDWHHVNPHSGPFRLTCPTRRIADGLIEAGVAQMLVRVVPWGIDVQSLHSGPGSAEARQRLGLPGQGAVLLTASPPSRAGGHFTAAWATAILHQVRPRDVLVVPGESAEAKRLERLLQSIYCPEIYFPTGYTWPVEELLAAADLLVFNPQSEVSTAWISWAMAAGVPVVGSRTPAVQSVATDGLTAVLTPSDEPHLLATAIRGILEDPTLPRQCAERAQGEAVREHDIQRVAKLYSDIYANLAGQAAPV